MTQRWKGAVQTSNKDPISCPAANQKQILKANQKNRSTPSPKRIRRLCRLKTYSQMFLFFLNKRKQFSHFTSPPAASTKNLKKRELRTKTTDSICKKESVAITTLEDQFRPSTSSTKKYLSLFKNLTTVKVGSLLLVGTFRTPWNSRTKQNMKSFRKTLKRLLIHNSLTTSQIHFLVFHWKNNPFSCTANFLFLELMSTTWGKRIRIKMPEAKS